MPPHARILAAGTLIATTIFAGAAGSQVLPTQTQSGDILANQTLNVEDVQTTTTAATTATGNSLAGGNTGGGVNQTSTQTMQANADARATVNGDLGAVGNPISVTSQATGNSGSTTVSGGDLTATSTQATTATAGGASTAITAEATVSAANGQAPGGGTVEADATANTHVFGADTGTTTLKVTQTNAAQVQATSVSTLNVETGQLNVNANALSNDTELTGTNSTASLTVGQTMNGAMTSASANATFTVGADQAQAKAVSAANNVVVANDNNPTTVTLTQENDSLAHADATVTANQINTGTALAHSVGNSALVGGQSPATTVTAQQTNVGGVEAFATISVQGGGDATATSMAGGNTITGYGCTLCGGVVNATSTQTNFGGVSATTSMTITGSIHSVTGTASAVGNSATFYVTHP